MNKTKKSIFLTAALALALSGVQAQGVNGVFTSAKKKTLLEKNAPTLREYLSGKESCRLSRTQGA